MIIHPRFGRLRSFKDGDLEGRARRRVARHLAGCARCQDRLRSIEEIRTRIHDATRVQPPPELWDRIEESRSRGRHVILPGAGPARSRETRSPRLRVAALLALALVGTGAAAVAAAGPGSWLRPVRDLFVPPATEVPDKVAGVQVPIGGPEVTVAVESPEDGLEVVVRRGRGSELGIRATGDAADAVFRPMEDGVRITGPGRGRVEVNLPASVTRASVTVDGEPRWIMEGGRARTVAPDVGAADVEVRVERGEG
jgi:hypothetical protein